MPGERRLVAELAGLRWSRAPLRRRRWWRQGRAELLATGGCLRILRAGGPAPSGLLRGLVLRAGSWLTTERIGTAKAPARHRLIPIASVDRTASPESIHYRPDLRVVSGSHRAATVQILTAVNAVRRHQFSDRPGGHGDKLPHPRPPQLRQDLSESGG